MNATIEFFLEGLFIGIRRVDTVKKTDGDTINAIIEYRYGKWQFNPCFQALYFDYD